MPFSPLQKFTQFHKNWKKNRLDERELSLIVSRLFQYSCHFMILHSTDHLKVVVAQIVQINWDSLEKVWGTRRQCNAQWPKQIKEIRNFQKNDQRIFSGCVEFAFGNCKFSAVFQTLLYWQRIGNWSKKLVSKFYKFSPPFEKALIGIMTAFSEFREERMVFKFMDHFHQDVSQNIELLQSFSKATKNGFWNQRINCRAEMVQFSY